ncbi:GLPGLI family protein [Tamlana sp. 2201CG12-4]|uniref:GLPGLI family protein n=1 Tax=Tamlana sp. 2201CG12-4 TaxID=3112582 RepID=UPI002DB87A58|nr:GLPGLI family protein [Tamlana sp. 2201CG12-4]MEC3907649.1 GLPGLI family protein [Tamlana sp. 2201CG12-4]
MKQLLIMVFALNIFSGALAQDFQGIATYKTKRRLDVKLDSTQMNSEMHQRMIAMLKKRFEKTYILSFNREASIYKEDEVLEAPQTGGIRMMVISSQGSDILYKNIKEHRYTSQNEVIGKIFLIKDELKKLDWTLTSEVKNIGDYTCYKATTKRMVAIVENRMRINGDRDMYDDTDEEPQMKEVEVMAWYTPQIPVSSGPARYYGLPGLILEVNDGEETIVCSKIVLNPDKKVAIKEPHKGKEINQEDFETIVEKKMEEQRNRFQNNRNQNGNHLQFRIGG